MKSRFPSNHPTPPKTEGVNLKGWKNRRSKATVVSFFCLSGGFVMASRAVAVTWWAALGAAGLTGSNRQKFGLI